MLVTIIILCAVMICMAVSVYFLLELVKKDSVLIGESVKTIRKYREAVELRDESIKVLQQMKNENEKYIDYQEGVIKAYKKIAEDDIDSIAPIKEF